jgi:hypothetical protein
LVFQLHSHLVQQLDIAAAIAEMEPMPPFLLQAIFKIHRHTLAYDPEIADKRSDVLRVFRAKASGVGNEYPGRGCSELAGLFHSIVRFVKIFLEYSGFRKTGANAALSMECTIRDTPTDQFSHVALRL